jgi:hypothetical protein
MALLYPFRHAAGVTLSPMEQHLADWEAFGWHWTGSSVQEKTAEWLARQASGSGMRCEIVPFAFPRTQVDECHVQDQQHRILGLPLFNHPATDRAGISGLLASAPEAGDIAFLTLPPQARVEEALAGIDPINYKAALIVTTGAVQGLAPLDIVAIKKPLPVVQVSSEALPWLQQAKSEKRPVTVVTRMSTVDGMGRNVLAAVPGRNSTAPPIVISTGLSGWGPCTGERGGPLWVWLTIAAALSAAPPDRGVVMLAADGEELGGLGRSVFAEHFAELTRNASIWLELGANLGARESTLQLQAEDGEETERLATRLDVDGIRFGRKKTAPDEIATAIKARLALRASPAPQFHLPGDLLPTSSDLPLLGRLSIATARAVIDLTRL